MSKFILNVENMVCPRCVLAVENLCATLSIEFETVKLGKIYLTENTEVSIKKKEELNQELQKIGLQLIESDRERLISELKITIIITSHFVFITIKDLTMFFVHRR